jgi:hypothetical protein
MRHLSDADPKVDALLDHLHVRAEDKDSQRWYALIKAAFNVRPQRPGGMSGWVSDNDSTDVETLEAIFNSEHRMLKVWEDGVRHAVWNPDGVRFFTGSREFVENRFKGIYTLASSDQTYVGYSLDWKHILVYHVVDEDGKV